MKNFCAYNISCLTLLVFLLTFILACNSEVQPEPFDYGTKSDSARYYYLNGFHEILDNGRWTESERFYRKALEFDPDYTLGKSLVGRITRNLEEREKLLQEIQATNRTDHDENLLLEVYMLSIEGYNNRDKGIRSSAEFNSKRKRVAESNFREFVRKYPEDDYVKAEYIEWLHHVHGPQIALDSLNQLATQRQNNLGFYVSYAASLELELGHIEKAISYSERLKELMVDSTYTSYLKHRAEIYLAQDSIQKAKEYIDRVVQIDSNHIIALGMQARINQSLEDK